MNFLLNLLNKWIVNLWSFLNRMALMCIFKNLTISTECEFAWFTEVVQRSWMLPTFFFLLIKLRCSLKFISNIIHKSKSDQVVLIQMLSTMRTFSLEISHPLCDACKAKQSRAIRTYMRISNIIITDHTFQVFITLWSLLFRAFF